jgi:two-component system KDP operon response regulator KdpE
MKILIIDDDPAIVENLELTFKVSWPDSVIVTASQGQDGISLVETESPGIIILDLGLPDINGFEVLKRIRLFSNVPIVVLTVRSEEGSVVKALEWGADEYIIKPFRQMELLARIKSIIKRQYSLAKSSVALGDWIVDFSTNTLTGGTRTIRITSTESIILHYLLANRGSFVTGAQLASHVWGENYPGCEQALRVHIRHLRTKIEDNPGKPRYITTKAGEGYSIPR